MIETLIIQIIVMLAPMLVFVAVVEWRRLQREKQGRRNPVKERLLRAPGHSLREKLNEMDWKLSSWLGVCMTIGGVVAVLVNQSASDGKAASVLTIAFCVTAQLFFIWKLLEALEVSRHLRLGLSGELAVGEELNKLMLKGCHVFHDFPGGPD